MGLKIPHGSVILEQNSAGEWAWISDREGTVWVEIDVGVNFLDIPTELHYDVASANLFAGLDNARMQLQAREDIPSESEHEEWDLDIRQAQHANFA